MPSMHGMFSSIGPALCGPGFAPERERAAVGLGGVPHPERHGAGGWAVRARECLREGIRLRVDDEVDLALAVQRHVLGAVPRDHRKAQPLEQRAQQLRIGRGVLDELEAVGAHRVVVQITHAITLRPKAGPAAKSTSMRAL